MEEKNKSTLVLTVIAVVVLAFSWYVIGALRSVSKVPSSGTIVKSRSVGMPVPPAEDSIASIDSELQGMSVDGLDNELADIEKELNY